MLWMQKNVAQAAVSRSPAWWQARAEAAVSWLRKAGACGVESQASDEDAGSFTARDVQNLAYAQGGKCRKCLRSLAVTGYHVDHIVPIARGGLNVVGNLQLLCPRCNLKKGCK